MKKWLHVRCLETLMQVEIQHKTACKVVKKDIKVSFEVDF